MAAWRPISLANYPFAQRNDQASFLSQGNERVGRNHALLGVMPANEGFEATDAVARNIDHWLVVEFEFAGGKRPAQIILQGALRLHLRVHVRLEEAKRAASIGLGSVECQIRVPHEFVVGHSIVRPHRDAHAGADDDLMTFNLVGCTHRLDDPVRKRGGVSWPSDGNLQNREFIAAHTRDRVGLSHQPPEPTGYQSQELIARGDDPAYH